MLTDFGQIFWQISRDFDVFFTDLAGVGRF